MKEDKTDRLLEALRSPEKFTDEELETIFADESTRELYSTMSEMADAMNKTVEPDIESEWEYFKSHRLSAQGNRLQLFVSYLRRNAAAVLICVVAASGVVAASIGVTYSFKNKTGESRPVEKTEKSTIIQTSTVPDSTVADDALIRPATVVFKNTSLENILSEISAYYGATVSYKSTETKALNLYFNWSQSRPLGDVINQLDNFDRINIRLDGNVITVE